MKYSEILISFYNTTQHGNPEDLNWNMHVNKLNSEALFIN